MSLRLLIVVVVCTVLHHAHACLDDSAMVKFQGKEMSVVRFNTICTKAIQDLKGVAGAIAVPRRGPEGHAAHAHPGCRPTRGRAGRSRSSSAARRGQSPPSTLVTRVQCVHKMRLCHCAGNACWGDWASSDDVVSVARGEQ